MAQPSYILANDSLARHQKASIDLIYNITGAKAGKFVALPPQALVAYDASVITQAAIDALLGSVLEFDAADFTSTAMGTDALGLVLDCGGQIAAVHGIKIHALTDDGAGAVAQATQLGKVAPLVNTSLAAIARVEKSALGNLGVQMVVTGLDAATSGQLQISILVDLK
jgi:hypothetical protein